MSVAELLKSQGVILLDGAMGTELDRRKVAAHCEANLANPDIVLQVHKDYVAAGSTVVIANTLTVNRIFVESHQLDIDIEKVNRAGAKLANEAVRGKGFALGNLSSTGQMLEPLGIYSEDDFVDAFKEQAEYLADEGVDGFIIETMTDVREAVCALKACRMVSALPVIACIAYFTRSNGGRTVMGNSAEECARALEGEGAAAIGANCGSVDPEQMAEIIGILAKATRLPIVAEPNAGKPRLVEGSTLYDMKPEDFASGLAKCRDAGARVLGGCCGTSPEHMRAFAEMLKK